jgi:peroxiredoxin
MAPKLGDVVGDFTFLRPDGRPVRLAAFTAPALVLIFLRHLA